MDEIAVAPLAGAWIEIFSLSHNSGAVSSLPLRERGLKLDGTIKDEQYFMSLPLRERGLKLLLMELITILQRRSPCGSVD